MPPQAPIADIGASLVLWLVIALVVLAIIAAMH